MKKQNVKVELIVNGVGIFEAQGTGGYSGLGKALASAAKQWAEGQVDAKTSVKERMNQIASGFLSATGRQTAPKK